MRKCSSYGMAPTGGRGYAQQPQQQPAYRQQPQAQPQQPAYAQPNRNAAFGQAPRYGAAAGAAYGAVQQPVAKPPLPQVNEDEIDYDANYGEYTFNSENFSDPHAPVNVPPVIEPEAPAYANQQHVAQPAAAGAQAAQSFAQSIPQPPAPEPVILPEQAPAFPGAFPATYPAGGAGAFPDVAHVAEAAGGTPGMPGNAAYAGVPGTVAFTAGAAQANQIPNANAVRARLIDVASNRSYDLATNRVLLGRETGNDIVVNDLNASRQHAQIEFEPQASGSLPTLAPPTARSSTARPSRDAACPTATASRSASPISSSHCVRSPSVIDIVLLVGRLLFVALLYLFLFAIMKTGIGLVKGQRKREKAWEVSVERGPKELRGVKMPVRGPVIVGRSPGADIVIGASYVSARHARFSIMGQNLFVEDLGSTTALP